MASLGPEVPRRRFFRPTWAEIDRAALVRNLKLLKAKTGAKVMFVVKANAYGHGAVDCALAAEKSRAADWLGVSSVEEGLALREAGLKLPVMVLGSLYPFESILAAVAHELTPAVASLEAARRVAEASTRVRGPINVHVKVDTGMGRIGVRPEAAPALVESLAGIRGVKVQGIYTHLASADSDAAYTRAQLKSFRGVLDRLSRGGLLPPLVHAANTAGALRHPASRFDMIRPGLAAYGLYPGFEPVMTLKSKIVFLKSVPKGSRVSYGGRWKAARPSRVATLPIGYGDGYSRLLSNKASVLVGGRRCPVIGTITMDQVMLDVTAAPEARVGDDAVLIGPGLPASELAEICGTIVYETVTGISSRVPRVGA